WRMLKWTSSGAIMGQPPGQQMVSPPPAPIARGDEAPAPPPAVPPPTPAAPDAPIPEAAGAPGIPEDSARAADKPGAGSAPPVPESAAAEEIDVWWGSYSGWTLWPSTAVCILFTGLIGLGTWLWAPRDVMQWVFLGLAGALWLVQATRWAYRFFSVNYR